jgi:hypothetical protein
VKISSFSVRYLLFLFLINSIHSEARAQKNSFTGLTIEAASGYQSMRLSAKDLRVSNSKLSISNRSIANNIAPKNISGVPFALNIGYMFGVTESATFGVRLEYNPQSSRYAVVILPGYGFTERAKGYFRFGWAYMVSSIGETFPGAQSQTQTAYFHGPTFGIGARYKIIRDLYIYGEANYYKYNDVGLTATVGNNRFTGIVSSKAANILVGIGYRF